MRRVSCYIPERVFAALGDVTRQGRCFLQDILLRVVCRADAVGCRCRLNDVLNVARVQVKLFPIEARDKLQGLYCLFWSPSVHEVPRRFVQSEKDNACEEH